jgi:AraC-like DNA-binding protein
MAYPEYLPVPSLMPFIDRYTFMSVNGEMPVEKCIPNGYIRLYIIFEDSDLTILTADGKRAILKDALEGHPNEQVHSTQVNHKMNLVMCSFYPASFYQTFNFPIRYLNNQLITPENIFGYTYHSLKEQLQNTISDFKKKELLDQFFERYFLNQKFYKVSPVGILQAAILQHKGNINVSSLYASFGRCRRSMERDFLEQVGVGPKYFCRILRFNNAYALKRKYPDQSWNEILYTCGYYDQSHYIKEFKGFMDVSPETYFQGKHSSLDVFTGKTNAL